MFADQAPDQGIEDVPLDSCLMKREHHPTPGKAAATPSSLRFMGDRCAPPAKPQEVNARPCFESFLDPKMRLGVLAQWLQAFIRNRARERPQNRTRFTISIQQLKGFSRSIHGFGHSWLDCLRQLVVRHDLPFWWLFHSASCKCLIRFDDGNLGYNSV